MIDGLLVFALDERRFAIALSAVSSVIRAVEVTPLPQSPEIVMGVINVRGTIIPVVNLRKRFGVQDRGLRISDFILIAHTAHRTLALVVDAVIDVLDHPDLELTPAEELLPGTAYVESLASVDGRIVAIHNLNQFLSLDEEQVLSAALGTEESD